MLENHLSSLTMDVNCITIVFICSIPFYYYSANSQPQLPQGAFYHKTKILQYHREKPSNSLWATTWQQRGGRTHFNKRQHVAEPGSGRGSLVLWLAAEWEEREGGKGSIERQGQNLKVIVDFFKLNKWCTY